MLHKPAAHPVGWFRVGNFSQLLGTTQKILATNAWFLNEVSLAQAISPELLDTTWLNSKHKFLIAFSLLLHKAKECN